MTTPANIADLALFFQSPASGRSKAWIEPMNILPREKQIEVIAAFATASASAPTARITGVNRETVAALALQVGRGCAELHDRMMVGLRAIGSSVTSCGAIVGKKRKPHEGSSALPPVGDQYTYIALGASTAPSSPISPASATAATLMISFRTCASA